MKNHEKPWKTNLGPWETKKNYEQPTWNHEKPWKTMKTYEKPWKTMKNQPGTMKNHE